MRHLIAFDLDGTLVDSRLDLASSANLLLGHLGARPLSVDQVVDMVGEGARVLVGRVLAAAGVDTDLDAALVRFLEIYDAHLVDHTGLYPGVVEALSALEAHATLAVLTNKPLHHTGRLLDILGVRRFFFEVLGGDGPWPRKPDPAGLEYLMAAAGALPQTTIMVGDSMVDVETATRASARMCVARYGFGRGGADVLAGALVVDDARDLKARLLEAIAQ
jgi:phosphoglycolate phosphatase